MKETSLFVRPERRNNLRLNVELDVNLTIDGIHLDATTSNISCGGMFLPIERSTLPSDAPVEVMLHLPDSVQPVRLTGQVARYEEIPTEPSKGVAIRFNGLYDDNILAIDRFIKNKLN